jgi:hypothetical protein
MDLEAVASTLRAVVIDLEGGGLSASDIEYVWSLLDAGEPGVALEHLCDQLFEYDVTVPARVLEQISAAGEAMGLASDRWNDLTVEP